MKKKKILVVAITIFFCNQVHTSFHILLLDCFSLFIVVAKQGEATFHCDDFFCTNKILNAVTLFFSLCAIKSIFVWEAQTKMSKLPLVGSTLFLTLGSKLSKSYTRF